jgi:Ca-activated chloride channel family protein
MTLKVQTDRTLIRAEGQSTRYALVSFAAPESERASAREPVNVTFVIDRSGSMGGSKIRLALEAVVQALRMLKSSDRFSVVCYDHEIDLVVPTTLASAEGVRNAIAQVQQLQARGNTDLGGGWLKGCEELAQHIQSAKVSRCLLLTDGLANHGITDRGELARHAAELRSRYITTSTIGLGEDFDEVMLEGMARAGGGHFYYVETAVQVGDCLTGELGEALDIVAHDAAVTVQAPVGASVATLNRFPVRQDDGRFTVLLGDLASLQDVEVVFRLTFPTGQLGATARAVFSIADARGSIRASETDTIWTYADHRANDTQPRNLAVDRAVAKLYAAQATAEALDLNRVGRFDEAVARLKATAARIAMYAGSDPELRAVIESLNQRDEAYAQPMMARMSKAEHYGSVNVSHMRTAEGKARRRPTSE